MDSNGNIHELPDEVAGVFDAAGKQRLAELAHRLGVEVEDLEEIPVDEVARVGKMNRKARRAWHAEKRRKRKK